MIFRRFRELPCGERQYPEPIDSPLSSQLKDTGYYDLSHALGATGFLTVIKEKYSRICFADTQSGFSKTNESGTTEACDSLRLSHSDVR